MATLIYDYELEKGDTFRADLVFGDRDEDGVESYEDMTDAVASGDIRVEADENAALTASMDMVSTSNELLSGGIRMYVSGDDTDDFVPGIYYYSIKVVHADNDTLTHVKGRILVNPKITV